MRKVWEFFENMNECVYVSDMETYEIVYMTKKLLRRLGLSFIDEAKGKKCYEILQNFYAPCATCTNSELKAGQFIERQIYNPLEKIHMFLKDTVVEEDGRLYKVAVAVNINSVIANRDSYENLETIANEGLRLSLLEPTPERSLAVQLEYIGKALNGERTYIFEKNSRGGDDNTYEWTAAGITPEIDNLQDLPEEVCENWYREFSEDKNIIIKDIEDIKDSDPRQYENLKPQNIHSLVVVPLYENGKAIGFYGVDNPPTESFEYAENMLKIMGHFIVSTLRRRNLVHELQVLSFSDSLTKLGNRRAMNDYLKERLKNCGSVGVVYGDITGLKSINDLKGHEAGDEYIVSASKCLRNAFDGFGLFRAGGDEFLALCPDIGKNELTERVSALKKYLEEKKVIMAVGYVFKKGKFDTDKILAEAETLMYKEKTEYYLSSGIERRK